MDYILNEWLNLLVRWFHVIAAITWIGHAYFFSWLDRFLVPSSGGRAGVEGEMWMVHSGGFYRVEKTRSAPREALARLHWFKWEAALTWLSGFALLAIVYYWGGAMIDPSDTRLSHGAAVGLGVATLAVGWIVYDLIWKHLGSRRSVAAAVSVLLLVAVALGLSQFLPGRAAYMHVGALMGTLMVANVWLVIIPAQSQMVASVEGGAEPDEHLAAQAKARSRHNNLMSVPVVFIMVSNHFPTSTYGHDLNWAILAALTLVGGAVRAWMNTRGAPES